MKKLNPLRHEDQGSATDPGDAGVVEVFGEDDQFGMKIRAEKPSDKPNFTDIVAVHGLNGHYMKTWSAETPSGKEVNWLRVFLPMHVPNTRIMSYSYNSVLQFSKSLDGIDDFAGQLLEDLMAWRTSAEEKGREVIFIGHSLGSLVFKQVWIEWPDLYLVVLTVMQALNLAHERERYDMLLSQIKGVIFFDTPHRGSDLANWAETLGNILKVANFGTSTNTRLARELNGRSEILRKISTSFVERGKDLAIFSFYESEMMPNMNCKVEPSL